jgi:hypothetical protein
MRTATVAVWGLAFGLMVVSGVRAQTPMGTAFTYQGYLQKAGQPVNDTCDLKFSLWDGPDPNDPGHQQVGQTLIFDGQGGNPDPIEVMDGLFTIRLDFGPDIFNGDGRWLEIAVKGSTDQDYSTLLPRQELTPTPYALALPGFWTQQTGTSPNLIGGYCDNIVNSGVVGATIAGGGNAAEPNRVTDNYGTVGGGRKNKAGNDNDVIDDTPYTTIGGGRNNRAVASAATVGGGESNSARAWAATVAGGSDCHAAADGATVGGGRINDIPYDSGVYATIGGGYYNVATGDYASIGGGRDNQVAGNYGTVAGGYTNEAASGYATVGGGYNNHATNNAVTIAGGEANSAWGQCAVIGGGYANTATAQYSTVGGGTYNDATGGMAVVGGGHGNEASSGYATVAGGQNNTASDAFATVGGGNAGTAGGYASTVAGGWENQSQGDYAMVPGGAHNSASGAFSFAAGRRAKANHDGAFVWADSTEADFASTSSKEFIVRASGGIWFGTNSSPSTPADKFINTSTGAYLSSGGTWTNACDRNVKENFVPIDGREVLERLTTVPISTWNYKAEDPAVRHMSPMAQDLYAAFGLGQDEQHISTIDADGVALAAIQGVYAIIKDKDAELATLKSRNRELESRLADLETRLAELAARWGGGAQ